MLRHLHQLDAILDRTQGSPAKMGTSVFNSCRHFTFYLQHLWFVLTVFLNRKHSFLTSISFSPSSRIFCYITIDAEGLCKSKPYAPCQWPLNMEGSLSCHICCDRRVQYFAGNDEDCLKVVFCNKLIKLI